jgi:hypothetical protein
VAQLIRSVVSLLGDGGQTTGSFTSCRDATNKASEIQTAKSCENRYQILVLRDTGMSARYKLVLRDDSRVLSISRHPRYILFWNRNVIRENVTNRTDDSTINITQTSMINHLRLTVQSDVVRADRTLENTFSQFPTGVQLDRFPFCMDIM